MRSSDVFVAVFAYNRSRELNLCLTSLKEHCPGLHTVVYDDKSADPDVVSVIQRHGVERIEGSGGTGRHGGLYPNMQAAYESAQQLGFRYLLSIQDDMQFVRPLDARVYEEYTTIFADPAITQVDPRFARSTAVLKQHPRLPAFEWVEPYFQTYSDIGLFSIEGLSSRDWRFIEGEKANRKQGAEKGLYRVFPFTPIAMQIPFPSTYRARQATRVRRFVRPGSYAFSNMTATEQNRMDRRASDHPPYYRDFLRVSGGLLGRWRVALADDAKLFK